MAPKPPTPPPPPFSPEWYQRNPNLPNPYDPKNDHLYKNPDGSPKKSLIQGVREKMSQGGGRVQSTTAPQSESTPDYSTRTGSGASADMSRGLIAGRGRKTLLS